MNIIDKLKSLGVEITDEIEKALAGDWLSESEVNKKLAKMQVLEDENKDLKEKRDSLEKDLQSMKDSASDSDALNQKITDLTNTLEKERKERKEKDEIARLDSLVTDFFADKHFVNAITADAIKKQLVETLNSDEARGKSVSDLFDAIVKDEKGDYKPDIIIDDKTFKAQQSRSRIVGNNFGQPDGAQLSMAELMKLKNQNPDMDITPYLKKGKEK